MQHAPAPACDGPALSKTCLSMTYPQFKNKEYRLQTLYNTVYNCTVCFVLCTVVQSLSSEQEIDSHMFHMSTSWSEDLVSCQSDSDHRTNNIVHAKQYKLFLQIKQNNKYYRN